jgi:very-short-patch-repair endonuclease
MAAGFVVLRLPNHEILNHPDRVLDQIRRHLSAHLPAPLSLRSSLPRKLGE